MNPSWELRLVDDAGMLEVRHKVSSLDGKQLCCAGVAGLPVSPLHCTAFPDTKLYVKVAPACQRVRPHSARCFSRLVRHVHSHACLLSKVQHASGHACLRCHLLA